MIIYPLIFSSDMARCILRRNRWLPIIISFAVFGCLVFINQRKYFTDSRYKHIYSDAVLHKLLTIVPFNRSYRTLHHAALSRAKPLVLFVVGSDQNLSGDARLLKTFLGSQRVASFLVRPNAFPGRIHQFMHGSGLFMPIKLVVFEDFLVYFSLPGDAKKMMDDYCRQNSVGIIGFFKNLAGLRELVDVPGFVEVQSPKCVLLESLVA